MRNFPISTCLTSLLRPAVYIWSKVSCKDTCPTTIVSSESQSGYLCFVNQLWRDPNPIFRGFEQRSSAPWICETAIWDQVGWACSEIGGTPVPPRLVWGQHVFGCRLLPHSRLWQAPRHSISLLWTPQSRNPHAQANLSNSPVCPLHTKTTVSEDWALQSCSRRYMWRKTDMECQRQRLQTSATPSFQQKISVKRP